MPNFILITFKTAVLQGGRQNLPSPCMCYPKDPMWNRVKTFATHPFKINELDTVVTPTLVLRP